MNQQLSIARPIIGPKLCQTILAGMLCLLLFGYLSLFNQTALLAKQHENHRQQIASLEAEIASLEVDYLAKTSKLTLEYAEQLGFVEAVDQTVFAYSH